MEWTTQTGEGQAETYGNGHHSQPPPPQPPAHLPEESVAPPVTSAPPPVPTHAAPAPSVIQQAPSGFEQCPSCGALAAVDQRYCLECGRRRGEPRLPFMDAVVFMDAMNRPPETPSASPKSKKRGISPNAALIAGVGTLLLALGIGVLIGRSGNHTSAPASQAPIVIKGGTGEEEAAKTTSAAGTTIGGKGGKGTKKTIVKQKKKEAESGKGAEEVLKPVNGVKMPPATVQLGDKCEKGTAGCENGEYTGNFFGP